ncbi:MAG: hypothetical protein GX774_12845 [Armatimonadetes bacterium]|jgi:hypothetical protein|nr:hypothetical protein [Armatimonadota bacterium]
MSEEVAAQPGGEGRGIQPLAAPADERIARRRREPGWATLSRSLPWLVLLVGTYSLQRAPVVWRIADGRMRGLLLLAALAGGASLGLLLGSRDSFPWKAWPPEGTLFHRRFRLTLADVAQGWWQYVWLAPLGAVGAMLVAAIAALALVRPQDLSGLVHAADLCWYAFVAAFAALPVGRVFQPGVEAFTARGVHPSPAAFVSWRSVSHAVIDREARVARLYGWQRPWLPRCTFTFRSEEEMARVCSVLEAHVVCLGPGEQALGERLRWLAFSSVLLAVTALLTLGAILLLLAPGAIAAPVGWLGTPWASKVAYVVAELVARMPEFVVLLTLLVGSVLHGELERLRGLTMKRIVWEGA